MSGSPDEERRLTCEDMAELATLHRQYKQEIGEEPPDPEALGRLREAIVRGDIWFYGTFGTLLAYSPRG